MPSHAKDAENAAIEQPAPAAIPWDKALEICAAIRAKNLRRWYTPNGMMCRGCVMFSGSDAAKMCFASRPDNRGCYQVNARYDQQLASNMGDAPAR